MTLLDNPLGQRSCDLRPAQRRLTDRAVEIVPPQGYRTPAWYAARLHSVSASEIPAILGLSPYTSRFDLWWAKHEGEHGSGDNADTRRGRRIEPLVIEDFTEAHPEFSVGTVGLVANVLRQWQVCTPDGLVYESHDSMRHRWATNPDAYDHEAALAPVAVLEAKTAANSDGWGEAGTDDIPLHYKAQVLWQLDTLGLDVAYVGVWLGYTYKEYVVHYDWADVAFMRAEAREFLTSLHEGTPPDVDAHPATTDRLKRLHPTVEPGHVDVPAFIVRQHAAARRLRDAAQSRMDLAENRLRALMGDKAIAKADGRKVASRSVYDVPAKTIARNAYTVNRLNITRKPPASQSAHDTHGSPAGGVKQPPTNAEPTPIPAASAALTPTQEST